MTLKRDALDAVFSDLVREAADWVCQNYFCSYVFNERKGQDAHCSHFFSRKYNSTRWFPDNAILLCARCHSLTTDDHDYHVRLFKVLLGEVRYEELMDRKHKIVRYRKSDKDAMKAHYKEQLIQMRAKRNDGVKGVLPIVAYD